MPFQAQRADKSKRAEGAIKRAIVLFDVTMQVLVEQHPLHLEEVLRPQELLRRFYYGTFDEGVDVFDRHFRWFALAARAEADQRWHAEAPVPSGRWTAWLHLFFHAARRASRMDGARKPIGACRGNGVVAWSSRSKTKA